MSGDAAPHATRDHLQGSWSRLQRSARRSIRLTPLDLPDVFSQMQQLRMVPA
jgi:hypothetical protein